MPTAYFPAVSPVCNTHELSIHTKKHSEVVGGKPAQTVIKMH